MAQGDWGKGTMLVPVVINITVDESLRVDHVGIGYHLVTPSGQRHESGYTWHSPRGQYAVAPREHTDKLQEVVDELLQAAADHEGVELR